MSSAPARKRPACAVDERTGRHYLAPPGAPWKKRPVIVVSRNAPLRGKVTVLPCTTDEDNARNPAAVELSAEIQAKIDHKRTWVICDHLTTVATSRLDNMARSPPRVRGDELTAILQKAHSFIAGWLPAMKDAETTFVVETRSLTLTEVEDTLTIEIEHKRST
ncbi:type II toxin-antitoxin system PemK/MazF family toxin [Rhizobium sp. S152]|uniref:type II toxin-antitoxin system PemK/MazF family toxin n=1 Tax=Rhizobium sp. S152 TaxID=3055038 RepID=UPI0025A99516|nr:type II toxin-antitoxin system PemK/MazF family toxin [Rhizobium sp. S152]MDM9625732.1 type II toxin-antitoxin system PemK/MazF family toxin [Rhizobium sp. S152]